MIVLGIFFVWYFFQFRLCISQLKNPKIFLPLQKNNFIFSLKPVLFGLYFQKKYNAIDLAYCISMYYE